jgi:hypothetical protein
MRPISIFAHCRGFSAIAVTGVLAAGGAAHGALQFTGGSGAIVFGVADYGGAPQANPVYIPNTNATLPGVMESPGHGFLTADLNAANNVAQFRLREPSTCLRSQPGSEGATQTEISARAALASMVPPSPTV